MATCVEERGWLHALRGEDGYMLSRQDGDVLRREDGYMMRREDDHLLRRSLEFAVEDQRKKEMLERTWKRQVKEE